MRATGLLNREQLKNEWELSLRIYQLLYVTALIAASVNLFGLFGILVGCAIAGAWVYVFSAEVTKRRRNLLNVVVAATLLFLFTCCLLPGVSVARDAARRVQCLMCVKHIALAMVNYEARWKSLPPAITYDAHGKPMHSWRVLLLPYLDEIVLYEDYNFNEPWDGPNNSKLLSRMPFIYQCPSLKDHPGSDYKTSYRVLVGERTCFPQVGSRKLNEIIDGSSATLLCVESNKLVPWMAPIEPTVDEYLAEMKSWSATTTPHHYSDLLKHYDVGASFAMADGIVFNCGGLTNERLFEKMVFIDDGRLTESELEEFKSTGRSTHIRWEGWLALASFLFLAVFPVYWMFRDERNAKRPV